MENNKITIIYSKGFKGIRERIRMFLFRLVARFGIWAGYLEMRKNE